MVIKKFVYINKKVISNKTSNGVAFVPHAEGSYTNINSVLTDLSKSKDKSLQKMKWNTCSPYKFIFAKKYLKSRGQSINNVPAERSAKLDLKIFEDLKKESGSLHDQLYALEKYHQKKTLNEKENRDRITFNLKYSSYKTAPLELFKFCDKVDHLEFLLWRHMFSVVDNLTDVNFNQRFQFMKLCIESQNMDTKNARSLDHASKSDVLLTLFTILAFKKFTKSFIELLKSHFHKLMSLKNAEKFPEFLKEDSKFSIEKLKEVYELHDKFCLMYQANRQLFDLRYFSVLTLDSIQHLEECFNNPIEDHFIGYRFYIRDVICFKSEYFEVKLLIDSFSENHIFSSLYLLFNNLTQISEFLDRLDTLDPVWVNSVKKHLSEVFFSHLSDPEVLEKTLRIFFNSHWRRYNVRSKDQKNIDLLKYKDLYNSLTDFLEYSDQCKFDVNAVFESLINEVNQIGEKTKKSGKRAKKNKKNDGVGSNLVAAAEESVSKEPNSVQEGLSVNAKDLGVQKKVDSHKAQLPKKPTIETPDPAAVKEDDKSAEGGNLPEIKNKKRKNRSDIQNPYVHLEKELDKALDIPEELTIIKCREKDKILLNSLLSGDIIKQFKYSQFETLMKHIFKDSIVIINGTKHIEMKFPFKLQGGSALHFSKGQDCLKQYHIKQLRHIFNEANVQIE